MEEQIKRKGIKIGEEYLLKSDRYNLILETYGYKKSRPKEKGGEPEVNWGLISTQYFANLKQVLEAILRDTVNEGVNLEELTQVVNMVENFRKDFEQFKNITQVNGDTMEIVK